MRELIHRFLPDLEAWISLESIAKDHLDPTWTDLIQHAMDGRRSGWNPNDCPGRESVQQTLAFAEHAKPRAACA
jgi:hypothetical protein